jgi:hypothetical protein
VPNGLAHLPLIIARREGLKTTFSTEWPQRTRAEGGQVEPVLGSSSALFNTFPLLAMSIENYDDVFLCRYP